MATTQTATASLVLVLAVALQGCGANARSDRPTGATPSAGVEATTARGLAAGVLAHLEPYEVVEVSGIRAERGIRAWVATSDPAFESIYIEASEPLPGRHSCGGDSGYEQISCTLRPNFIQVVKRKRPNLRTPVYIGRAQTAARGLVLVEIFGKRSSTAVELLNDVLQDALIGLETSNARNTAGESIADFQELVFEETENDR